MAFPFLFATGIENSNPTLRNGTVRVDELEKCGHYQHWRRDFDLVQELGIEFLRCGPPIHTTWRGVGNYDWSFADETFADLRRRGIVPIVDLCHFGLPDWLGNFQNPDFPALFAGYARAFARRFPWVQFYTPVNEIYVCARFSALLGWWNEQLAGDRAFVTALKYLVKANVQRANFSPYGPFPGLNVLFFPFPERTPIRFQSCAAQINHLRSPYFAVCPLPLPPLFFDLIWRWRWS